MSGPISPEDQTYQDYPPTAPQGNQPPFHPYPPSNYPPMGSQPPSQPADQVVRSSDYGGAHAESRYSSYIDEQGTIIERRQQFYHDPNQQRANIRYGATALIYFLLGVLEVILALRWLFRLLGANTDNNFISFLYSLSHFFVAPFNGIFNDQALGRQGVFVFEFSTLIGILVYALIGWGLVTLINLIFRPVSGSTDSSITTRRRQY
jgi:hypothetical protein